MEENRGGSETSSRRAKRDVSGGQHVRITKEKVSSAKAAEQNFRTEIFRVAKIMDRRPRVVYQLEDLNGNPMESQFFREELTSVRITDRTTYKIKKLLDKRVRRAIREYIVR